MPKIFIDPITYTYLTCTVHMQHLIWESFRLLHWPNVLVSTYVFLLFGEIKYIWGESNVASIIHKNKTKTYNDLFTRATLQTTCLPAQDIFLSSFPNSLSSFPTYPSKRNNSYFLIWNNDYFWIFFCLFTFFSLKNTSFCHIQKIGIVIFTTGVAAVFGGEPIVYFAKTPGRKEASGRR